MIGSDISVAKSYLDSGEVIAIPTETVYGLAANATDAMAVAKIFDIKNRPHFDPLIIHTHSLQEITKYAMHIPQKAIDLLERFSPGPITILLPKNDVIPNIVTSGLQEVAVRIPNHPLTLALLTEIDYPLAAPSANPFGYISPTSAEHVAAQLGDKIPYILDGGNSTVGIESTIVRVAEDKVEVLRLGGLSLEILEGVVGKVCCAISHNANPSAPGQLDSHYAPRKPLYIVDAIPNMLSKNIGYLSFGSIATDANHLDLSSSANLQEAAANLFNMLRMLDNMQQIDSIEVTKVPDIGLGRAINDRLQRAAFR